MTTRETLPGTGVALRDTERARAPAVKSTQPTLTEKVAFLKRPASFGGTVRSVRAIETHFAWVFLAGKEAWKLKKPVRHRQMDYRSLAARRLACREELRLNRRLAPEIYLAAVPLTISDGRLSIDGAGKVVDWLVRMRRLPDAAMLDRALPRRSVSAADMDRIARVLLRFYAGAHAHPLSGARYLHRLSSEIRGNEREIARHGDHLTRQLAREVRMAQLLALQKLRPRLAARGAYVVDGHGDLRAEHVCAGARVHIIDALDFDRNLRLLDPAEEISLLALEIERLGQPELAERLLQRFRRGMTSPPSMEVFSFYRSQRAATRAKLAAWHIGDPQFPDVQPWIDRTESLLADALRYADAASGVAHAIKRECSVADGRPTMEQRSQGRSRNHPGYGFGEERGHMQFR